MSSFSNLTKGRIKVEAVIVDDNGVVIVNRPATSTVTSVNNSNANQTLKAANTARAGLSIQNTSPDILYVKLGTTASSTDYTVKMVSGAYYEVPYGYTGRIDGIWAATSSGAALVDELT